MPKLIEAPMHLLDEPEVAMRVEIPDGHIEALARDISEQGLINAISVKRNGERYTIGAGHCRFLAFKQLGRLTIPANDFTDDNVDLESIKISENLCRHDVSDAEMALYLSQVQEKYHYDMNTLMRITRRSENWINTRLQLFQGDKDVFDALAAGHIKIGHAVVLNRFPDNFRKQYLLQTINSTPPIRVIENWLLEFRNMGLENVELPPDTPAAPGELQVPGLVAETCWICGGSHMPWTFVFPRTHEHCKDMVTKKINEAGE